MAHNEKFKVKGDLAVPYLSLEGKYRFAPDLLIEKIGKQNPKSIEVFRAKEDTDRAVSEAKDKFREGIRTSANATIIFENHGLKRTQHFSNDAKTSYSSQEFAEDIITRQTKNGLKDTLLILNYACLTDDYINDLFRILIRHNDAHRDDPDQQVSEIVISNNTIPNQLAYSDIKEEDYISNRIYPALLDVEEGEESAKLAKLYALGQSFKKATTIQSAEFMLLGNVNIYYFSNKKIKEFMELLNERVMQAIYQITQVNDPETIHLFDAMNLRPEKEKNG